MAATKMEDGDAPTQDRVIARLLTDDIVEWAGGVADALDGAGLDILITNAVNLTSGPIGSLSLDAIRREFDINVLGTLSVINAFLPALRRARGRNRFRSRSRSFADALHVQKIHIRLFRFPFHVFFRRSRVSLQIRAHSA